MLHRKMEVSVELPYKAKRFTDSIVKLESFKGRKYFSNLNINIA